MAGDYFIDVDGIPGESTDKQHPNLIEVLSYNHGVSQLSSGSRSSVGSGTAERCSHGDFSFTKYLDKGTPLFNQYCCQGDHIPLIKMYCRRAKGTQAIDYMIYELTDSIVTSVDVSGDGEVPVETVSFNYASIKWTYVETDDKDNSKGQVESGWSVEQNTKI